MNGIDFMKVAVADLLRSGCKDFFFFFGHLAVEILGLGSCHCTFCRWRA